MSLDSNLQSAFTAVGTAVKGKIGNSEKGVANGVATLDGAGKVPQAQLPGFLDDVLEYANYAALPGTGTAGIIYIDISNGKQYRWSGSAYASTGGGAVDSVAGKVGAVTLVTSDISGLDTALANKAASSHTHSIPDVTGLQGALDAKATITALSTLSTNVGATDTNYVTVFNAALVQIMSLDSNISDLATAIGQEIKDVRADMAIISGGGGSGTQNVFIQEAEPAVTVDSLWIQRLPNGNLTMWLKGVQMLENMFGELANDLSIKNLMQKFGRFSFDSSSQLRVGGSVGVSSLPTLATVTTVTTANMSIGDMGKPASVMLQSAQGFYGSVGANFTRS